MSMTPLTQPVTDADHVWGSLAAEIVILEYGDYDCPHTRAAHGIIKRLMIERPGKLALVFRHFPLRHIHRNADALSRLMQAIVDPERYRQAHDALMAIHHMSLPAAHEALAALGHDVEALTQDSPRIVGQIQRDVERGQADGVHSTPSFFFNGAPWDGHYDLATLRQQLDLAAERLS
jgi:protein-disulfide isomerase